LPIAVPSSDTLSVDDEALRLPSGKFRRNFAKCELNTAEAKGLPWAVHVNATDLTITNLRTKRTFKAGCPTTELDKTIASVTVTLESPTAISEMEFSGSTTGYKTVGSLTIEGANNGTYGIG
jgi:hypothetical protein